MTYQEAILKMVEYANEAVCLREQFYADMERARGRWDAHRVDFNMYKRAKMLDMKANKLRLKFNIPCIRTTVKLKNFKHRSCVIYPVEYCLPEE